MDATVTAIDTTVELAAPTNLLNPPKFSPVVVTPEIFTLSENAAGSSGELEDDANFTYDGSKLNIGAGTGVTVFNNGNAVFAGIVTVGGDLVVTGDYSVDEISARNLILTGIATIPTLGVTGLGTFEKLTVGTGVTLQEHGGVSIAGITTIGGNIFAGGNITAAGDATINGGDLTLTSILPSITFNDTNNNPDFKIEVNAGSFLIKDTTNAANKIAVNSDGHVDITPPAAFSDNVTISGVTTTGENLGGFKRLVGAASSTVVSIAVTVATKTADHRYF